MKNSGLNAFLFAEVGTELNGSQLTVLSILARLGQDPWAEAARWAQLPKAAMIDCLVHSIAQMPLCPQALVEARVTASRLALLLPSQNPTARRIDDAAITSLAMPAWAPLAFFCCALAIGMAVNAMLVPNPPRRFPYQLRRRWGKHREDASERLDPKAVRGDIEQEHPLDVPFQNGPWIAPPIARPRPG